jgi:hypothetical protein
MPPTQDPEPEAAAGTTKLTPEVASTILTYIEGGAFDYVAAEYAKVSARTFREWVRTGEVRAPVENGSTLTLRKAGRKR